MYYFILQDDNGNYVTTVFDYHCSIMGDDPKVYSCLDGDINLAYRFNSYDEVIKHKSTLKYSEGKEYKVFKVESITTTIGEVK